MTSYYTIPPEYYFRIHHVRPRFKANVESVLLYIAQECAYLPNLPTKDYNKKLFDAIRLYPGNESKKAKTIDNWRTEIAALFGFYIEDKSIKTTKTGTIAKILDEEQDLVQFFKYFLFNFQYPGGHVKSDYLEELINSEIRFKPAKSILRILHSAESYLGKPLGITKAEATHCIFNDLRVTRDQQEPKDTIDLIIKNRINKAEYDSQGDVVRYAGDILDYMVIANLLKVSHGYYYLNRLENEAILAFIESDNWFQGYEQFYNCDREYSISEISDIEGIWFEYVNTGLDKNLFKTDILSYIEEDDDYKILVDDKISEILESVRTKDIGDLGESLVLGHEKVRVKNVGREDLIHLINKIPTSLGVGYDIQSVEQDARKRYIEVKTTISNKKLALLSFHMTPNEWSTAESLKDRYFVYRLMISKEEKTIYILQDPVGLYKQDIINMQPRNGVEITFIKDICEKSKLMLWKN